MIRRRLHIIKYVYAVIYLFVVIIQLDSKGPKLVCMALNTSKLGIRFYIKQSYTSDEVIAWRPSRR